MFVGQTLLSAIVLYVITRSSNNSSSSSRSVTYPVRRCVNSRCDHSRATTESLSQSTFLHSTSGHGTRQSCQWKQQQKFRRQVFNAFCFYADQTPGGHFFYSLVLQKISLRNSLLVLFPTSVCETGRKNCLSAMHLHHALTL